MWETSLETAEVLARSYVKLSLAALGSLDMLDVQKSLLF